MRSIALLPALAALLLAASGPAFAQQEMGDAGQTAPKFSLPSPIGPSRPAAKKPTSPWADPASEMDNPWANRNLGPNELPYGEVGPADQGIPGVDQRAPLSPYYPDLNHRAADPLGHSPFAQPLPGLAPPAEPTHYQPYLPKPDAGPTSMLPTTPTLPPTSTLPPTFTAPPTSTLPPASSNPFRPSTPPADAATNNRATMAPIDPYPSSTMYGPFVPGPSMGPFTPSVSPAAATTAPQQLTGPYSVTQASATGIAPSTAGYGPSAAAASRSPGVDAWYAQPQNRTAVDQLRQQFNAQRGTLHPGYYGPRNNLYGGRY